MIKTSFVCFVLIFIGFSTHAQTIELENSVVSFSVSNMAINKVKGTFRGMNGSINFDLNNVASSVFDVCIDAATIDTGNSKRDKHLRNEDFFGVETYPTICFKSSKIVESQRGYIVTGTLSMHGISKTIEIPFTYINNSLKGEFKVDRFDYKIGEGTGKFMVGKEISIKINATLKY